MRFLVLKEKSILLVFFKSDSFQICSEQINIKKWSSTWNFLHYSRLRKITKLINKCFVLRLIKYFMYALVSFRMKQRINYLKVFCLQVQSLIFGEAYLLIKEINCSFQSWTALPLFINRILNHNQKFRSNQLI